MFIYWFESSGSKFWFALLRTVFLASPVYPGAPCLCPHISLTYPNASYTGYDPVTTSTTTGPRTPQLHGLPQARLTPPLQRPLRPLIYLKAHLYLLPKYPYQNLHRHRRYHSPQMERVLSSSPPRFQLPPSRNLARLLRPLLSF